MNNNYENPTPELSAFAPTADGVIRALREIYVAVGLSSDDALRSALADYECQFTSAVSCAA